MKSGELSLRDYLMVLRRRMPFIVVASIVAGLLGFFWSDSQTRLYSARADVLVDFDLSAQITDPANQNRSLSDRARRLENELQFAKSNTVAGEVEDLLGEKAKAAIKSDANADIITFAVIDDDPDAAADKANTFARAYTELRAEKNAAKFRDAIDSVDDVLNDLRGQLAELPAASSAQLDADRSSLQQQIQIYEARKTSYSLLVNANRDTSTSIINEAEAAKFPISPNPGRTAAVGVVLALMATIGLALVLETLDDKLQSKDDLDAVAKGVTSLALIPRSSGFSGSPAALPDDAPMAEAFRNLRTSFRFVALRQPMQSIQITSANPSEGKTTVACHLAVSLAKSGVQTVLIDADLRSPRLHERFELGPNIEGLASVMLGQITMAEAVRPIPGCPDLWVVPAGPAPGNPGDFLWPANAPAGIITLPILIEQLVDSGYTVIVDSPPVLPVADALTLSRVVDGTIFVAAARRTRARAAGRALELLGQADARIVGTVLNRANHDAGGYGYGYGYGYGKNAPTKPGWRGKFDRKAKRPVASPAPPNDWAARNLDAAADNGEFRLQAAPTALAEPAIAVTPTAAVASVAPAARVDEKPAARTSPAAQGKRAAATAANGSAPGSTNGDHAGAPSKRAKKASPRRLSPPQSPVLATAAGHQEDELVGKLRSHLGIDQDSDA